MRIVLLLSAALALAACGGTTKPGPTPTPTEPDTCGVRSSNGVPTNAEQCACLGHQVVGDIGDGQVSCPDGTAEVARIAYGIEGGVCCEPAAASTGE